MRPTQTPAADGNYPLGAVGAAAHDPFNRGRLSSPRPSVSTDPGDTPTSTTTSLGDGSGSGSVPPLGQLTPPSLPPQEDWEADQAGAAGSGGGGVGGDGAGAGAASVQVWVPLSNLTVEKGVQGLFW